MLFKDKYGDKREEIHLVKAIDVIKKKENETIEEFNKRFNGIIKELPQDYKPLDKSLLDFYIDVFNADTSYELRRAKTNDYKVAQVLVEEIEKDKKASGKSEIPGFDRGPSNLKESKGKEIKGSDDDPMQKLMQLNFKLDMKISLGRHRGL